MNHRIDIRLIFFFVTWAAVAAGCSSGEPDSDTLIIDDVHVVTMDSDEVLAGKTVVIRDGAIDRIVDVGSDDLPDGQVVDGQGRYLMPGLIDMHAHVLHEGDLTLFVANGVTTIRNMAEFPDASQAMYGFPAGLALKTAIADGELFGPSIVQAGHILDGDPPFFDEFCTPIGPGDDIDAIVAAEKAAGYDYLKVYWNLSPEQFEEIGSAATEHGMPIVGHVPFEVPLDDALQSGSMHSIEHLTGYYDYDSVGQFMDVYGPMTAQAGVWNVPTLVILAGFVPLDDPVMIARMEQPELRYISPHILDLWAAEAESWDALAQQGLLEYSGHSMFYFQEILVPGLTDAGAGLLLGTDCGMPYNIAGVSIHDELELLVGSGLSPYEALQAGTSSAALSLGRDQQLGSVTPGKRADLVLLDANPLQEISHTRQLAGVVLNGVWHSHDDLDGRLEELAASFQ